jgi:hypothetical protein
LRGPWWWLMMNEADADEIKESEFVLFSRPPPPPGNGPGGGPRPSVSDLLRLARRGESLAVKGRCLDAGWMAFASTGEKWPSDQGDLPRASDRLCGAPARPGDPDLGSVAPGCGCAAHRQAVPFGLRRPSEVGWRGGRRRSPTALSMPAPPVGPSSTRRRHLVGRGGRGTHPPVARPHPSSSCKTCEYAVGRPGQLARRE